VGQPKPKTAPGELVGGRYELAEIAGRGGMAVVWRGILRGDFGFARPVAVKQMHAHLAEQSIYVDMFAEEARVGAELHDPNIAQTYDFVVDGDGYYLVMEWVDGIDLGSYIHHMVGRGEKTPWELVTAIGIGVLRGLAAAHERCDEAGESAPIVHRDVSPHNILINRQGMAKLIDFGLSLARDRGKELTEPGIVKGKMAYLAPEIVKGERPSPASDEFATGSVLWEALVGRKLFEAATDYDVYRKLRDAQVEPLRPCRPDLPPKLIKIINRALSADPAKRFPSTREMARQLGIVLKGARDGRDLHARLSAMVATVGESEAARLSGAENADVTPVAEASAEIDVGPPTDERRRGLRHKLSQFLRGR
jgi:eukaryotic-like serine/threonine-protein kinase